MRTWFRVLGTVAMSGLLLLSLARDAAALKISAAIPAGYEFDSFELTPDAQLAVYGLLKDGSLDTVRLVVVPVAGGTAKTLVDIPLTGAQRSVDYWEMTPDGTGVVFLSDKDANQFRTDLFYVPIDGSAAPLKVNVAPAPNDIATFRISPDASRVVFETLSNNKIYSAPTTGGTVVELGTGTGSFLPRYRISPDTTRVVFTFNDGGGGAQIYSIPIAGGATTKLTNTSTVSLPGTNGADAEKHAITPDGSKVLFFAGNFQEIWITPIDQMAPVKLAGPFPLYTPDFRLTPDGTTVIFIAGTHPAFRIYRVPVNGSAAAQAVSGNGQNVVVSEFQMSPNGQTFVYRVFNNGKYGLFAVGLAGGNDIGLTPTLPAGIGAYNGYRFDPASQRAVYNAEQDAVGVIELYSVPIGGGTPIKLNKNPMPATADVDFSNVKISPDGLTVLFVADQDTDAVNELYSSGLASGGPQKVHPNLAPDKDVASGPRFTADSQKIVYAADQDTDGVFELFVTDDPAPDVTATPTPGSGATATPTPPGTPTPLATRTPAPETPDRCADCIDNDFDGTTDRADPECPPLANGAGIGLTGDAAKAATKCQKALGKVGTNLALKRVKALGSCLQKAFDCVQRGGDAVCLLKAGSACGKSEAARQAAITKLGAVVAKSCGDPPVAGSDLGVVAGLGFAAESQGCTDFGATIADAAGVAACLAARHACRAEELVGVEIPRARELLTLAGHNAALEAPCLPPGGAGGNVPDAKAVLKCQKALVKAGATYGAARLKAEQKCADGVFACVQVKPTDAACRAKADAACTKLDANIAAAATKLQAALAKGCGGTLGLGDILDPSGIGFGLRAGECTALTTASDSIAGIASCITAQHACRVDQILIGQSPRGGELGALAP